MLFRSPLSWRAVSWRLRSPSAVSPCGALRTIGTPGVRVISTKSAPFSLTESRQTHPAVAEPTISSVIDGYIDDRSSLMESNVSCAAIQYRSIFTAIAVVLLVAGCSQLTALVTNPIASSTPAASEASSYPVCMKEGNSCATPGSKCCAGLVCVGAQNGFCTTKQ